MGILAAKEIHTNSFFQPLLAEIEAVKLLLFVKYGNINKIQNTYL
jgi:hypothetical protein